MAEADLFEVYYIQTYGTGQDASEGAGQCHCESVLYHLWKVMEAPDDLKKGKRYMYLQEWQEREAWEMTGHPHPSPGEVMEQILLEHSSDAFGHM